MDKTALDYLAEAKLILAKRKGNDQSDLGWLEGAYVCGSLSQNDFQPGISDIDIFLTSNCPISQKQSELIESHIFPLFDFSKGVEICVVLESSVGDIRRQPAYEFRLSKGGSWIRETERSGVDGELLIHFEICRTSGITLLGKEAYDLFAPVPRAWIIEELREGLEWHLTKLLDPYHDPCGRNSTLNACRALYYSQTGKLVSKSAGGEWFHQNNPSSEIVDLALANRKKALGQEADYSELFAFVETILSKVN